MDGRASLVAPATAPIVSAGLLIEALDLRLFASVLAIDRVAESVEIALVATLRFAKRKRTSGRRFLADDANTRSNAHTMTRRRIATGRTVRRVATGATPISAGAAREACAAARYANTRGAHDIVKRKSARNNPSVSRQSASASCAEPSAVTSKYLHRVSRR